MKTLLTITAMLTCFILANAQRLNVGDFNSIDAGATVTISLIQSDSNVVTQTNGVPGRSANVKVENGVLRIHSGPGKYEIRVKNLEGITARDAATIKSQKILNSTNLKINVSDASTVILDLNGTAVEATTKDASTLKLAGTASSFTITSSDASTVKASDLQTTTVNAISHDASRIMVCPITKITAKADGSSLIKYVGSPTEKNTSATDASVVKSDDGKTVTSGTDISSDGTANDSTDDEKGYYSHGFNDGFIGWGYVLGSDNAGATIRYGRSREFYMGVGGGYKFVKWNGIGVDVYYKSTGFFLNQDSTKKFPNTALHNQEKIALDNFGATVFDRFFIKHMFFDGGVYFEWAFSTRHVTWDDNHAAGRIGSSTKVIDRGLTFANTSNYGLSFRLGWQNGVSFYFNYRLSDMFKTTQGYPVAPPEMPQYTLGIVFGSF